MQAIDRPAIGERETGHALARRHAPAAQRVGVQTHGERSLRKSLQFVVEINHASVERNDVPNLIYEHRKRALNFERRDERARDFIKSIDLEMRAAYLILSRDRRVFSREGC